MLCDSHNIGKHTLLLEHYHCSLLVLLLAGHDPASVTVLGQDSWPPLLVHFHCAWPKQTANPQVTHDHNPPRPGMAQLVYQCHHDDRGLLYLLVTERVPQQHSDQQPARADQLVSQRLQVTMTATTVMNNNLQQRPAIKLPRGLLGQQKDSGTHFLWCSE